MLVKFSVTKEILEKTANCRASDLSSNCAVAVAVQKRFPRSTVVNTGIYIGTSCELIPIPPEVKEFIMLFDTREAEYRVKLEPIDFEVDIPEKYIV